MTELAVLARLRGDADSPVEKLTCHPRLPLAVAVAADCRTVRVLDCGEGQLRELAALDAEPGASPWGDSAPQAVAWHPHEPLLLVADGDSLLRWTPGGTSRTPAANAYEALAFDPDGTRLWATPSSDDYEGSDLVDPATGAATPAPFWDTGVGVHPSGALVATLVSDQGATHCLFARPGDGAMRVQRQALILDCDGYGAPLFSSDGRHFAIRGNAYVDQLEVFAFPSLQKVLSTTLSEDRHEPWAFHNLAWDTRPGLLWIGTPTGSLLEFDVEAEEATGHPSDGVPVSALATTAAGDLLLARGNGEFILLSVRPAAPVPVSVPAAEPAPNDDVAVFLSGTEDTPSGGELDDHLVLTDGTRSFTDEELATGTETSPGDPTWLQIQASMNRFRGDSTT